MAKHKSKTKRFERGRLVIYLDSIVCTVLSHSFHTEAQRGGIVTAKYEWTADTASFTHSYKEGDTFRCLGDRFRPFSPLEALASLDKQEPSGAATSG